MSEYVGKGRERKGACAWKSVLCFRESRLALPRVRERVHTASKIHFTTLVSNVTPPSIRFVLRLLITASNILKHIQNLSISNL
jgi:hypothetical protein